MHYCSPSSMAPRLLARGQREARLRRRDEPRRKHPTMAASCPACLDHRTHLPGTPSTQAERPVHPGRTLPCRTPRPVRTTRAPSPPPHAPCPSDPRAGVRLKTVHRGAARRQRRCCRRRRSTTTRQPARRRTPLAARSRPRSGRPVVPPSPPQGSKFAIEEQCLAQPVPLQVAPKVSGARQETLIEGQREGAAIGRLREGVKLTSTSRFRPP
jgi:hypothetical protein